MIKALGFVALLLGACAGMLPRPCDHVGLTLSARKDEAVGPTIWAGPATLPAGWRVAAVPVRILVTVHNGTFADRVIYLQCGAEGAAHPVEVAVPASSEQDVAFAMPQREISTHFSCEIVGDRIGS